MPDHDRAEGMTWPIYLLVGRLASTVTRRVMSVTDSHTTDTRSADSATTDPAPTARSAAAPTR